MSSLDKRGKDFENKFAHDQELEFKAVARRNKLLGLWAAGEMGLTGDDAEAYAREVVKADFEEAGEEDVYRKVAGDLEARNVDKSEHQIRRTMQELMVTAREQVANEG